VEGLETSAQFVQIAPPNDIVVSILFEMTIGDVQGAMSLCIPYMVLKPITTKLSAQKWFATTSRRGQAAVRKQIAQHLQEAPVSCKFELGRCPLTIRDFLRLRPGDVVRLDQKTDRDLRMIVGNRPKFFVRPALDGHRLVFSVTHAYE
jgi:flagellar motor switch protein FliM